MMPRAPPAALRPLQRIGSAADEYGVVRATLRPIPSAAPEPVEPAPSMPISSTGSIPQAWPETLSKRGTAPPAASARSQDGEVDGVVRGWLITALFASIFLQRFALPIGQAGIAANLFVTLLALAALAARGVFVVDLARAGLLFVFLACVWVSAFINAGHASVPSAMLVMVIYLPFALALRAPHGVFQACIRAYQTMVLVCALCGIAQYLAQFVIKSDYLFTFEGLFPDSILLHHFGNQQPLYYGSQIFKSNGFFLVEPSTFSQYLALAILFEVLFFGGLSLRMVAYGVALPLSYSGTGLIVLILLMPWVLLQQRAYKTIGLLVVLVIIALATGKSWHMDALIRRVSEFGYENTSATARYIAAAWLIADKLLPYPQDLLFGYGPGAFFQYTKDVAHETHDPVWAKLLFEYGLFGLGSFILLFATAVFAGAPSTWVAAALTIGFLTFGGMLLDPRLNLLILLFCVLPKGDRAAWPVPARPMAWPPAALPALRLRRAQDVPAERQFVVHPPEWRPRIAPAPPRPPWRQQGPAPR